ncbi:MAG: NifB/NifX family molybdenum-iron cluster-binding protein [Fibrobacterota bacterium]
MKIAIPTAEGTLCPHFGHCEKFYIVDADQKSGQVSKPTEITPPPHEPGVIPKWLHSLGVNAIIAGGMGMRAQQFFQEFGIQVIVGASAEAPDKLVKQWLSGSLVTGSNVCDH